MACGWAWLTLQLVKPCRFSSLPGYRSVAGFAILVAPPLSSNVTLGRQCRKQQQRRNGQRGFHLGLEFRRMVDGRVGARLNSGLIYNLDPLWSIAIIAFCGKTGYLRFALFASVVVVLVLAFRLLMQSLPPATEKTQDHTGLEVLFQ